MYHIIGTSNYLSLKGLRVSIRIIPLPEKVLKKTKQSI